MPDSNKVSAAARFLVEATGMQLDGDAFAVPLRHSIALRFQGTDRVRAVVMFSEEFLDDRDANEIEDVLARWRVADQLRAGNSVLVTNEGMREE